MTGADDLQYWWCLTHEQVETDEGCANSERLGPFASYAEASTALELARRRTEAWDKDAQWNDDA